MSIDSIKLLRNIGRFDSVSGANLVLKMLALIYAENGRGKTTLTSILRSAHTNDSTLVMERHRLGAANPPHVILGHNSSNVTFSNGAWAPNLPDIMIFDDTFVAQNVCSGLEIEPTHRLNLHELVIGEQGVSLNNALRVQLDAIEAHNRNLRTKSEAIPASLRGDLSADDFCDLPMDPNIDDAIQETERNLAVAKSSDAVKSGGEFVAFDLPSFNVSKLNEVLSQTLPDLEEQAAQQVQGHIAALGHGESWVGQGMAFVAAGAPRQDTCPFCAQSINGSPLIRHYQAYFGAAYKGLKGSITAHIASVNREHRGDVVAAFERAAGQLAQRQEFWRNFVSVPDVILDTASVVIAWNAAREHVMSDLRRKESAPLDAISLSADAVVALEQFDAKRTEVAQAFAKVVDVNPQILLAKERAGSSSVKTLESDLARLKSVKFRHQEPAIKLCTEYLAEKTQKIQTEKQRDASRQALDTYRQSVFPAYETSINTYLQRFNANFRLTQVGAKNSGSGSYCNYSMLIDNASVALSAGSGPCFRNTLSAGDRNTLALAFFFASLDQAPNKSKKIVVIDDPMTSLDEHRTLATVQQIRKLAREAEQVIVLSHSKSFLCTIWQDADRNNRSSMKIVRDGQGSTFSDWDVRNDSVTEHDRRHEKVMLYIQTSDQNVEREVAEALRPILEAFLRVAYPGVFQPGGLLGNFIEICNQRMDAANQVLKAADITELRDILDYANRFHHDSNPAWATQAINDQELKQFCERTIAFARRT